MIHNFTTRLFRLCLLAVFLAGCTHQPAVPQTAVTHTLINEKATSHPPAFTGTSGPGSTPLPTQTHTPIPPTYRPTTRPTYTPTSSSVPILADQTLKPPSTKSASLNLNCEGNIQNVTSLSPDGNWKAVSCGYNHDQTLIIASREGKRWDLQFMDYLSEDFRESPPIGALYPVFWSGELLYFASSIGFSGGGFCRFRSQGGQGLYQMDLNTGKISATLPPLDGAAEYRIAFSPDGRSLAYNAPQPVILDLDTGEETAIPVGDIPVGDFTWSPDGTELAFATCQLTQDFSDIKESTLQIFSLDTNLTKTVLKIAGKTLHLFGNENLRLKIADDEVFDYDEARKWHYDWSSGQLIVVKSVIERYAAD